MRRDATTRLDDAGPEVDFPVENALHWHIQVYCVDRQSNEWKAKGSILEYVSVHPYTALMCALLGDGTRKPLQIFRDEIVLVRSGDWEYWFTAIDLLTIAQEMEGLLNGS